jgi:hypothetical protein
MEIIGFEYLFAMAFIKGLKQGATGTEPVVERCFMQFPAELPFEHINLPIKRQVIHEFRRPQISQ